MTSEKTLERAIRIYKATYDVTDTFFLDVLGLASRTTWKRLRTGKREFTVKQAFTLAETLGMDVVDLYRILPESNH